MACMPEESLRSLTSSATSHTRRSRGYRCAGSSQTTLSHLCQRGCGWLHAAQKGNRGLPTSFGNESFRHKRMAPVKSGPFEFHSLAALRTKSKDSTAGAWATLTVAALRGLLIDASL